LNFPTACLVPPEGLTISDAEQRATSRSLGRDETTRDRGSRRRGEPQGERWHQPTVSVRLRNSRHTPGPLAKTDRPGPCFARINSPRPLARTPPGGLPRPDSCLLRLETAPSLQGCGVAADVRAAGFQVGARARRCAFSSQAKTAFNHIFARAEPGTSFSCEPRGDSRTPRNSSQTRV